LGEVLGIAPATASDVDDAAEFIVHARPSLFIVRLAIGAFLRATVRVRLSALRKLAVAVTVTVTVTITVTIPVAIPGSRRWVGAGRPVISIPLAPSWRDNQGGHKKEEETGC
jgi:hypothetical protein